MTSYGSLLDDELYQQFLSRYRQRLRDQLGEPEPYYYTYKRILMWASRRP
jgi:hypothetical protein